MSNKGVWEYSKGGCKQGCPQGRVCTDPFMSPSTVATDLGVYEAAAAEKAIIQLA